MKKFGVAVAVVAGVVGISPNLYAQTAAKPSPYSGVSQPPPDETITAEDGAATPAKLVARPAAATPAPTMTATAAAPAAPAPPTSSVPTTAPASTATPPAKWNPDYGMIGDTPAAAMAADAPKPRPVADADADIVTAVPARPGDLPEGTIIRMALNEDLSTTGSQSGSDFSGRVAADVLSSGRVVIPQGAEVVGKVVRVTEGRRFGSPSTIRLRPDVVVLPDGSRYVLRAQIVDASGKSRVDNEGALKPNSRLKTNVIKEGSGIGAGALAGGLIGGAPGVLVGSIIGAGVMTTNILVQPASKVNVPKDSTLTLSLTQPMSITPVQND